MNAGNLTTEQRVCCWLVGLEGMARQVALPINGTIFVGRDPCNHIALDDVRLSRQHARVASEQDRHVVYDLDSVNGTFVNDELVTRRILRPNDVVRFGPYAFRVEMRDATGRRTESARLGALTMTTPFDFATQVQPSSLRRGIVDFTQLEAENNNLRTLHAFMQAISKTIDKRELLELITAKIREFYPIASMVGVYLRNAQGARGEPFRVAHSFVADSVVEPPAIPDDVKCALVDTRAPILADDSRIAKGRGTSMYVPMIDRDETLGVIQVSAQGGAGAFSRADLDLLGAMATPAAIMLQNARMHEASLVRDRLNHDLELAAQIQKSFLPREVITVEGLDLFAEYRAAYTVGGDFYDVFWVGPNRLGLFIGDISGKGVSAALLMARISSELRVAALAQVEPVAVLSVMNKATLAHRRSDLFFTAVYLTIDTTTGEVLLANAGHPPPYLCRADGRVEAITAGAAGAVGILENGEFKVTSLRLAHGASLVLYTDGVIEASNASGDLYGSRRLENCLEGSGTRASDIAEHILDSVADHSVDGPGNDDLTLFICQRYVGRPPSLQPRRRSGTQNFVKLRLEDPR
jgi:sigma-B regulation protein RsbU (phosphoserine phosphatase)